MKKAAVVTCVALFLISAILAVSVNAEIFPSKTTYTVSETVSIRNTERLCYSVDTSSNVTLYVVASQESWSDEDPLTDVRGASSEILNSQFSTYKKIWGTPTKGSYDIVIDCNDDGNYNVNEPVFNQEGSLFEVSSIPGKGNVTLGVENPGNHSWQYNGESTNSVVAMLQLTLNANYERIILDNMTIKSSGSGDEKDVSEVQVYVDANNNGVIDSDEVKIGSTQYSVDNEALVVPLEYTLEDSSTDIIIAYLMKQDAKEGEFALSVESILGTGEDSQKIITFTGTPISSNILAVLPENKCTGDITLELSPNPATSSAEITATVSGLSGCENKTITLLGTPCDSAIKEEIGSCVFKGEDCEFNFTAPSANKIYSACIDKNGDKSQLGAGEYAVQELKIIVPQPVNATNETEETPSENLTEVENQSSVTGNIVSKLEEFSGSGSFMILLEVTLLLILFVLTIIMFKLKSPAPVAAPETPVQSAVPEKTDKAKKSKKEED